MKEPLRQANTKIDSSKYTLKEIALYFKRFDGCTIKIETATKNIKVKIDKNTLPHILGLQYAFENKKIVENIRVQKDLKNLKMGKLLLMS